MTRIAVQTPAVYDCRARLISIVAGLAVAIPAGLAVTRLVESSLFLTIVVTAVGTGVAGWTYARVARCGARSADNGTCPM
jgi:hypothetical protein